MNPQASQRELSRHLQELLRQIDAVAILDILLVATVIYYLLMLAQGTRAMQLLKGLAILLVMMKGAQWLGMDTLDWIIRQAIFASAVVVVILFQPELRAALDQLGRGRLEFLGLRGEESSTMEMARSVAEITRAVENLAANRTGALIVIERETGLDDIVATGTLLNAKLSADLLLTIFQNGTALHDGAVLIRGTTLVSAGCILPLSQNDGLPRTVGTRHRAALGLSETTDAIVVVVSEETGNISLAHEGGMNSILQPRLLTEELLSLLDRAGGSTRLRPFARGVAGNVAGGVRAAGHVARRIPETTIGTLKAAWKKH
jgi:diadenylate cyclase